MNKERSFALLRSALSFLLIFLLTSSSVIMCIFSSTSINDAFSRDEYVNGVYNSIADYAQDVALRCSIDADKEELVELVNVQAALNEYIRSGYTGKSVAYKNTLNDIKSTFELKLQEYSNDTENIKKAGNDFYKYTDSTLRFKYADKMKKVSSIGSNTALAVVVLSAVSLVLYLLLLSNKRGQHIALCAFSDGLVSTGTVQLLTSLALAFVIAKKNLFIFPTYLCDMITDYARNSIISVACCGLLIFVFGVALSLLSMFKKNNHQDTVNSNKSKGL